MKYDTRLLTEADVPQIYSLCSGNPLYYQYCPPFVTEDSIRSDMKALPPGKTMQDKYYAGCFSDGELIAVMDYIHAFPDEKTDFIGFFMVSRNVQGQGVGSQIIEDLCRFLCGQGRSAIRLGWVKGNSQAEHFWKKCGFHETGVTSRTDNYTIIVAQKDLLHHS